MGEGFLGSPPIRNLSSQERRGRAMSCSGLRVPTDSTCGLSSIVNSLLSHAGGPLGDATCFLGSPCFFLGSPDVWVADLSVPLSQRVLSVPHPREGGGCSWLVLSRFAFWTHRATRASMIFAGGDAHCVVKPSPVRGFGDEVCCGCQAPPGRPHRVRHRGLQVVVTRAWCGPRGYIQVGKRG